MDKIAMLCPTRGRPDRANDVIKSFNNFSSGHSDLHFIIDDDDWHNYKYNMTLTARNLIYTTVVKKGDRPGIVDPLNKVAKDIATTYDYIGFMGDDHYILTQGWDEIFINNMKEIGTNAIVWGEDLYPHNHIPTFVTLDANIVRVLGYMAPPTLYHLFVDNFWLDLGNALETIRYIPEVIFEHRHYTVDKSQIDETYEKTSSLFYSDATLYNQYVITEFENDVKKLKGL